MTPNQLQRELDRATRLRRKDEAKRQAEALKRFGQYKPPLPDPWKVIHVNGRDLHIPAALVNAIDSAAYAGLDYDCGPDGETMVAVVLRVLERVGIVFIMPPAENA